MDEPPPPGLEPEVYYAPAPQVAPAPIPTVYQPPPVPYIPPHPNPPVFEAPAVVEALKEPSPEPPKPRVPKASVSVLQGGRRKLALSSQKSNLASRLVARSSQRSQKLSHKLKHATLRSDGQPNADAVFAASPPPQDDRADVSPTAEIPEPVAAYPAHIERRSRSGSPRRALLLVLPADTQHSRYWRCRCLDLMRTCCPILRDTCFQGTSGRFHRTGLPRLPQERNTFVPPPRNAPRLQSDQ